MKELKAPMRAALRGTFFYRAMPYLGIGCLAAAVLVHYFARRINISGELFGAGVFLLGFWPVWLRMMQWYMRKHPLNDVEVTWTFDDEGFCNEGEGFAGAMHWPKVHEVIRTDGGFLIYPQRSVFHWIPNHAFADPSNAQALEALLRSKHVPLRKI